LAENIIPRRHPERSEGPMQLAALPEPIDTFATPAQQ